jgi:ADP-ribose pyrophosphatase
MATELQPVEATPEEHEVIEVHWKPFDEALAMAHSGEIQDGKSLVGLFRAAALIKR